jgi:histidinol-phosphate phosphatase family protein
MKISVVFLDRDGVLNEDRDDYIRSAGNLTVYPFVPEAIRLLTEAGIKTCIISNQSGISRKYFSRETAEKMFKKVIESAESAGGKITDYYYCPHHPNEGCTCRKPKTGMIQKAVTDHHISLKETIMVGDARPDYETARNARIPFILVRTGKGRAAEKQLRNMDSGLMVCENVLEAVSYILRSS